VITSVIAVPVGLLHWLTVVSLSGPAEPPSWSRTTIASAPWRLSRGTRALTESASSWKSMSAVAAAVTMPGVPSSVIPTTPTRTPPGKRWIAYGGKIVSPVSL
jgi:hypothetical protein